jgi:hypothetical protein
MENSAYLVVGWDVLFFLDRMNKARRIYEQTEDAQERREMDTLFADCYDWLTSHHIPFYFDAKPQLWLLSVYQKGKLAKMT